MSFWRDVGYRILGGIDTLIKWHTRPSSKLFTIGKFLTNIGFFSLVGSAAIYVVLKTPEGWELSLSAHESDTGLIVVAISVTCVVLGIGIILLDVFRYIKVSSKTSHIVVEHIGLFKSLSSAFLATVTKAYGKAHVAKIDLSTYYTDGVLMKPEDAASDTRVLLKSAVGSLSDAVGNEEAVIHYGGTPSVSLGFYAGHFIGNTFSVTLWDYDRDLNEWHSLDRCFDENRPQIDMSEYDKDKNEVCLIMSISFDIEEAARCNAPTDSIVSVRMPKICHDNMSSLSKINLFKKSFRELMNRFHKDEVSKVHIFCASQSSFNFAMGQQITKNHPICLVYEYVNNGGNIYPWALEFNMGDGGHPKIQHFDMDTDLEASCVG